MTNKFTWDTQSPFFTFKHSCYSSRNPVSVLTLHVQFVQISYFENTAKSEQKNVTKRRKQKKKISQYEKKENILRHICVMSGEGNITLCE